MKKRITWMPALQVFLDCAVRIKEGGMSWFVALTGGGRATFAGFCLVISRQFFDIDLTCYTGHAMTMVTATGTSKPQFSCRVFSSY